MSRRRAAARVAVAVVAVLAAWLALLTAVPAASAAPGPVNAPEYWFDSWHVPQLWDDGVRGQGVTIAEIDTGVNATLPELRGRVLSGKDFGEPGNGQLDRDEDPFGHGTAMASIMVGRWGTLGITGLAPRARLLPVAVPLSGTTDAANDDHLAEAIRWSADHGAKIITMALGGTRYRSANDDPCPSDEQAAIYYALRKGAILFAAAGNRGQQDNAVEQPGVCLGVIAVGAVDKSGSVAAFSSRHRYVTFAAPGVAVPSLGRVPGTAYAGNGTSQATAIASALTALVWSKYPTLSGQQIVARLLATLDRRTNSPTAAYGYGLLNGYRAVTASVPADAPNPVFARAAPFSAREKAFSAPAPAEPKPAATGVTSTGTFTIGSAPRLHVPQVVAGIVIGLAGLLGLVALVAVPWWRRHRQGTAAGMPPPPRPRPVVDDQGVEWHEILGPQPPPEAAD